MISYCSILQCHLSIYNYSRLWGVSVRNEPLKIKKRGDDGNRIITVRIREETLAELDRISTEANCSRNELINLILSHGVKNIEIE